jgi:hypothetical protein
VGVCRHPFRDSGFARANTLIMYCHSGESSSAKARPVAA